MTTATTGIHHVTAVAGDPQETLDFWGGTLGMRFVKRTVNYDDPGTYHFYFGDERGSPGTLVTFFLWGSLGRGREGTGQVGSVALSIPRRSVGFWLERLEARGAVRGAPVEREGELALPCADHDGLRLELVGHAAAAERPGRASPGIPAEHAIRGVHAVTLREREPERTAAFLTASFGWREVEAGEGRARLVAGEGGPGEIVEIVPGPGLGRGTVGRGVVHHVAFRVADDRAQLAVRDTLERRGAYPTEVIDRRYFRSVYFREPGGVLLEVATDGPGFLVDERLEELGGSLRLPPWLEPHRAEIEAAVVPIEAPRHRAGGEHS